MALQPVLVTDTNIWIDLDNGGVLAYIFRLPYRFLIPDFAIPELKRPRWEDLETLGLEAHELSAAQVFELVQLRQAYRTLSIIDLSAFILAKWLKATLLTGDRRLIELANTNALPVHGVLWLLDGMVNLNVLTPGQAATALRRMLADGARLPVEESSNRLLRWSE